MSFSCFIKLITNTLFIFHIFPVKNICLIDTPSCVRSILDVIEKLCFSNFLYDDIAEEYNLARLDPEGAFDIVNTGFGANCLSPLSENIA